MLDNSYNSNDSELHGWIDFDTLDSKQQAEIKERITAAITKHFKEL